MKLGVLAGLASIELGVELPEAAGALNVTGFAIDNRKVAPGTVFGAFRGTQVNGEDFIPAAIAAGAVAVVARPEARSISPATSRAAPLRTLPRRSLRRCPKRWWR